MGLYHPSNKTQTTPYQIRTNLMGEKRDLDAMFNLENWAQELEHLLRSKHNADSCIELGEDSGYFESVINNFSLILMSKGYIAQSEKLIVDVVDFWVKKFEQDNSATTLAKALQPLVNLSRLYMCTQKPQLFWQVYNQYDCLNEKGVMQIAGASIERAQLGQSLDFLAHVSLSEKVKFFLKYAQYNDVLAMRESLPKEMAVTGTFLEGRIIAYLALAEYEKAEVIIRQAMRNCQESIQNIFYYRYFESLQCQGKFSQAESILKDICALTMSSPMDCIRSRSFAINLIDVSNASPSDELVLETFSQLKQAKDELNYGRLLVQQYHRYPTEQYRNQLNELFQTTQYIQLTKVIQKVLNIDVSTQLDNDYWSNSLLITVKEILAQS